jgi:hypothetical protein
MTGATAAAPAGSYSEMLFAVWLAMIKYRPEASRSLLRRYQPHPDGPVANQDVVNPEQCRFLRASAGSLASESNRIQQDVFVHLLSTPGPNQSRFSPIFVD